MKHAFHNLVAHPLLPLAEALVDVGLSRLAQPLFELHDATNPQDDARNAKTYVGRAKSYRIN